MIVAATITLIFIVNLLAIWWIKTSKKEEIKLRANKEEEAQIKLNFVNGLVYGKGVVKHNMKDYSIIVNSSLNTRNLRASLLVAYVELISNGIPRKRIEAALKAIHAKFVAEEKLADQNT